MALSDLHFSHPLWLLTLLVLPMVWGFFFLFYQRQQPLHQLEKFIDKHLIPFLLLGNEHKKKKLCTPLLIWSFVWCCLSLALAGPRWDFREIDTFTRDQSLVILLDLSESMNAKDISPSRLGRAKQKIEDLLNASRGVKMGLIAFAADPHMIVPLTDDKETLRHLLPSLETDLVYIQGSKLAPALEMAATMLENEPGSNKAIVIVSDGGFEDASAIQTAKRVGERGIVIYTIGVGTLEGAMLNDRKGAIIKKNGSAILSKLEKEKFSEISKLGKGRYFDAGHSEQVSLILDDLERRSDVQQGTHKSQRFWKEYFYLFILPVLPFFLGWYRRSSIFALLLFSLVPDHSQASLCDYFYNTEQKANQAYKNEDYTTAVNSFQDPYRKGVAYYRMGNYKAAEEMFLQSARPEVASSAGYNLGNALAQQNKLQEAIEAYEKVLEKWPDHRQANENLELVKKMLEQQEPQQKDSDQEAQKDSAPQKNKEQQKQKEGSSQKQDQKEQSKDQAKEDTSSEESEADYQEQKNDPVNESSQKEEEELQSEEQAEPLKQNKEKPAPRSQEDLDADLWLNQIKNNPKAFLKNKFYLESQKNGTKEEVDPW